MAKGVRYLRRITYGSLLGRGQLFTSVRSAAVTLMMASVLLVGLATLGDLVVSAPTTTERGISFEAEEGVVVGDATVQADANASSGAGVSFSTESTNDPPPNGDTPLLPTADTVGQRFSSTRTITGSQALVELRETGHLSRVTITGGLTLSGSDGIGWVIEDVRIESGSSYGLRTYAGNASAFTGAQSQRAVFRHVDIVGRAALGTGGCSAVVYGRDVIIEYADIYGCSDGIKASDRMEVRYSWVHDLDHPSGAHCDAVQIVSGTGIVFHGNRFDAYVGYSSDGSGGLGGTGSGVLQTGSVTGPISAIWTNNWFAGGHYTIRGADDPVVEYIFRNNRFMRFGTSVALNRTDLPPNRYGPTYGGVTNEVWENNVWDDTGELIQ